jgi:hypothetical protein
VKLQPVEDLVNHLALGAHREPDEIELGAGKPEVGASIRRPWDGKG